MTTPIIILCLLLLPLLASWVIGGGERVRFGGVLGIALAFASSASVTTSRLRR